MDPSVIHNADYKLNLKYDPSQNTNNDLEGDENFSNISEETINTWEV